MSPTVTYDFTTMTVTPAPNNTLGHVKPPPCACWRCATSRALDALGAAHETALEESLELEMREAFLRDEVAAALDGPLSQVKGRLRKALEVAR